MENQLLPFIFLETGTHSKKDELFLLYEPSVFFTVESPFEPSTISLPNDAATPPLKIPYIYLFNAAFSTGKIAISILDSCVSEINGKGGQKSHICVTSFIHSANI